ncbi:MAG: hypothetical protein RMJ28_02650 [Nitrososphaerota archaeon]|nr:DNA replication complex GINS family protein [Candidatus Calditenuaceae archaeon]MDW8073122.1 hypothetical protein [Nitrososphaerota archaeon]
MPQQAMRLEHLVSQVRVRMTRDVAWIRVGGRELGDLRQGSQVSLPLWAAEKVWEAGLGEQVNGPIDLSRLSQLTFRERRSPVELVELPEKFYYNVTAALAGLRGKDLEARVLLESFRDIVSVRMTKLLNFAARGLDLSLIKNLTEEERELYLKVKAVIDGWMESLGLKVR